jgi:hypothetical protein
LDHIGAPARTYRVAPSDRARRELCHCRKIIRDRARADKACPCLHCGAGSKPLCKETPNDD